MPASTHNLIPNLRRPSSNRHYHHHHVYVGISKRPTLFISCSEGKLTDHWFGRVRVCQNRSNRRVKWPFCGWMSWERDLGTPRTSHQEEGGNVETRFTLICQGQLVSSKLANQGRKEKGHKEQDFNNDHSDVSDYDFLASLRHIYLYKGLDRFMEINEIISSYIK